MLKELATGQKGLSSLGGMICTLKRLLEPKSNAKAKAKLKGIKLQIIYLIGKKNDSQKGDEKLQLSKI